MDKQHIHEQIQKAIEVLSAGGIIAYPTDTVWGLGCDATNEDAVRKIFEIKQRADAKSLIVLVCSDAQLQRTVKEIPPLSWELLECAQGPMTIIYDQPVGIAPNALAQDGSLGVRVVKDYFCEKLIEHFKGPIVSTSANVSGEPSPSCFKEINPVILHKVDFVVDHRQDDPTKSKPSTIIKLTNDSKIVVIRK